ncbi:MAG: hypothetical protein Q7J29_04280 [Stagnimonas sp.]|nr:hypothetical protein [Stagnimonas sp.]
MKISFVLIVSAAALLGACAGNQTCKEDASYRKAAAIPPIKPAEGLNLPSSPSALVVPEITPAAAQAAQQPMPKKGKGTACLDYPPEIESESAAGGAAKS